MYKPILYLVLLLILPISIFSNTVEINSVVNSNETLIRYDISFTDNMISSFSFEKPKNSVISLAKSQDNKSLYYTVAGDYFIFKPEDLDSKNFIIEFKTNSIINEIINKKTYSNYVNFNFEIKNLLYIIEFKEELGEVGEVFPRNFNVADNKYIWNLTKVEKDQFFLINFNSIYPKYLNSNNNLNTENQTNNNLNTENTNDNFFEKYLILLTTIGFIILLSVLIATYKVLVKFSYRQTKDEIKKEITDEIKEDSIQNEKKLDIQNNMKNSNKVKLEDINSNNINQNNSENYNSSYVSDNSNDSNGISNFNNLEGSKEKNITENKDQNVVLNKKEELVSNKNILSFEDYINKYLTDNEKEVVKVIKLHEGISQYDILNYLPHLTKSNLSKIISKLHVKKVLNRIKVGKVNKIHLGDVILEKINKRE